LRGKMCAGRDSALSLQCVILRARMAGWSLFAPRAPVKTARSPSMPAPSMPAPSMPAPTTPASTMPAARHDLGWRTALHHGLPVAGVVIVVVLVTAIAYFVYDSNRRGAIVLGNDLVTAIDRRVALQMHSYLSPAQQFLELADAAAAGRDVFAGGRSVQ